LVATGLAPILISVLPCAVMCALGLCFHKLFSAQGAQARSAASFGRPDDASAQSNPVSPDPPACCSGEQEASPSSRAPAPLLDEPVANERRDAHA
jgi:hypothetical protein